MHNDLSRRTALILLAVVVCYTLTVHVWFIQADKRPCNINELSHIMGPIDFANLVHQRPTFYTAYLEAFNGYPPIGLVTSAFYGLLGRKHDVAVYSQLVFTVLLLISIYGLGAQLLDRKTGLLAAWLLASCPAVVEVSRQYLLELPLTATSVMAVWLLLATDRFTNKSYSVAAGLAIGLTAWSKQSFLLFILGPVLFLIPGWIRAIRHETPAKRRKHPTNFRQFLRIILCTLAAFIISWLLYRAPHRSAIDNWFAATPELQLPYGMIFLIVTTLILLGAFLLLTSPSKPLFNGFAAGLLAVFVASLWYFPKGVLNFAIYIEQMKLNITQSHMSPLTLLRFYEAHLSPYYFGSIPLLALAIAAATLLLFAAGKRWLRRSYYFTDLFPGHSSVGLVLLWFGVPFLAFFFINIQNEMNTVPLMPPLMLAVAAAIARVRLPYSAKTLKVFETNRVMGGARIGHGAITGLRWLLIAAVVLYGVLSATPWPDGTGDYRELPGALNNETIVETFFARKYNDINYLVPMPYNWREEEISRTMFDLLPDTTATEPAPRVLIMDVDFYFSWNTFWYMAKLMNKRVEIRSAWDGDRDIVSPDSPDYFPTFRLIMYREPYKQIYDPAKRRSDYIDYKNVWKDFDLLANRPPEFASLFTVHETWTLPDESEATLLRRMD